MKIVLENKMYIVFLVLYTFYYLFSFISDLIISFSSFSLILNIIFIIGPILNIYFMYRFIISDDQQKKKYAFAISITSLIYYVLVSMSLLFTSIIFANADKLADFFSKIFIYPQEELIEEINLMISKAPNLFIQAGFNILISFSLYRIYKSELMYYRLSFDNKEYDIYTLQIVNFIYIIFIFIGMIFAFQNKKTICNIYVFDGKWGKNDILSLMNFSFEIIMRFTLIITLFIYKHRKKTIG